MPFKILYVEDNPQNMRLVVKMLSHAGYEMLEAVNGLIGVARADQEQPDLILMDINLPDISGIDAARRIKRKLPQIPIVAVTADAMLEDRERFLNLGFDDYVPKPITRHLLLDAILELLKEKST
jgi:CheY-like chemotaxis protein